MLATGLSLVMISAALTSLIPWLLRDGIDALQHGVLVQRVL